MNDSVNVGRKIIFWLENGDGRKIYIEFKVVIYTDGDNVKNETQESKLHDS